MVVREDYERREQAYVKHYVLKRYLQELACKVGNFRDGTTFNYIDGFSGPWQHATEDLRDTSPHIALTHLCGARDALAAQQIPRSLKIRAMFVEQDPAAFQLLRHIPARFPAAECTTLHGRFEAQIAAACRFATQGPNPFAFVFIDPTGWTGYGLHAIAPLLQVRPGEVLINFMTKDISRFIDDDESTALQSFVDLFGDANYREAWRGLTGLDREDAIAAAYCERIQRAGDFAHCGATVILNPQHDRTHYHLVFATRSLKGLLTFRDTERHAMSEQRDVRAEAQQRARTRTGNQELFPAPAMETSYALQLQHRYQERAREAVASRLRTGDEVEFDALVGIALSHPMTHLADLKGWLAEWRAQGAVKVLGLHPSERVLAVDKHHRLRWCARP